MTMENKKCSSCLEIKSVEFFFKYFSKVRNKYRYGSYCKGCAKPKSNIRSKIYYQEHKEHKLQYHSDYRKKNAEIIKVQKLAFKKKYIADLQTCYVNEQLPKELRGIPEVIEVKRIQLKIKRKIKENGKR